jgi:hypothetical protein
MNGAGCGATRAAARASALELAPVTGVLPLVSITDRSVVGAASRAQSCPERPSRRPRARIEFRAERKVGLFEERRTS